MRKRNLRYTGTEINCERWILLLWQHSEVVDDYYQQHMNDTHIIENIGDDIVQLWIEEFKIN